MAYERESAGWSEEGLGILRRAELIRQTEELLQVIAGAKRDIQERLRQIQSARATLEATQAELARLGGTAAELSVVRRTRDLARDLDTATPALRQEIR